MLKEYQTACHQWAINCFGPEIAFNIGERRRSFLEEALELVQASGATREEIMELVNYVLARPLGDKHQEVGGVMVTLGTLCPIINVDLQKAADDELKRAQANSDKIRERHRRKPAAILGQIKDHDSNSKISN